MNTLDSRNTEQTFSKRRTLDEQEKDEESNYGAALNKTQKSCPLISFEITAKVKMEGVQET